MNKAKGPVLDVEANKVAVGDRVKRLRLGSNGKTYALSCMITGFIPAGDWLLVNLRADGVLSNPYSERAEFEKDHYVCPTIQLIRSVAPKSKEQVGT